MFNVRKAALVFNIILIQSALAIVAGVFAIYFFASSSFPSGMTAGEVEVGGLSRADAIEKLDEHYHSFFKKSALQLIADSGEKYSIPYGDFDAAVDGAATIDALCSWKNLNCLPNLFKANFSHEKVAVVPVITFNESKLRQKLMELAGQIDREPRDADIYIENGEVVREPEVNGIKLNVANTVEVIRKSLALNPEAVVQLGRGGSGELVSVPAVTRLSDIHEIDYVLAEYSTEIRYKELTESIELAAEAINGAIVPVSKRDGSGKDIFSFVELLNRQNAEFDNDNEGYDQVASTLYAALLTAGVDNKAITRLPHKLAVDYIEPGLDAWISGSEGDLKFINPFKHKVAIFAEVEDGRLTVWLAGNVSDKKESAQLRTEITQRFSPPVVHMESKDLKPGEKVVLSPGKEGVKVDVYRNDELIGTDKYEAVKTIVQIGPKTGWTHAEEK